MVEKARLSLQRPPAFVDKRAVYDIYLDRRRVGTIGNEGQCTVEVEPGRYELVVRRRWWHSVPVTVELEAGTERRLVCRPAAGDDLFRGFYLTFFGRHRYVDVRSE
jgi:hypothetical protein